MVPQCRTDQVTIPSSNSEKGTTADKEHESGLAEVNRTGHVQELERNLSLLSICSVGIVTGNTWAALEGSIVAAIYNGGPPGVLYEFIAVSVFYWLVAASLAEFSSSMPSSVGIYHWASITSGPKYGRICGWFAGWWNTFAWICATGTMSSISSHIVVTIYSLYHPDYVFERWHVFMGYLIVTWVCCSTVLFANQALPMVNNISFFFILAGVFITVVICAVMPYISGQGYASSSFVGIDWSNQTGYQSNGFVFLAGMLNGAYAIGTPDCVSHLAEEIPNPKFAIFYATIGLEAVLTASFPIAEIYLQATKSVPATMGILRFKNPFNATLFCGIFSTCLGAIYVASSTAFNAFVGSFVVLSTLSYLPSIIPFIFTCQFSQKNSSPGPFVNGRQPGPYQMGHKLGYAVTIISCLYIIVFVVIYCFPYSMPATTVSMNYACAITGLVSVVAAGW